jgi:hypothetical protein
VHTVNLSSLSEFTDWVESIGEAFTSDGQFEAPWFRGLGSSQFKLVPGIYRTEAGRAWGSDDEVRAEFERRGIPMVADRAPRDDWEWYFLMQHYRAPTRLLDWTDSALVALYFAISSWSPHFSGAPAVCALNSITFNQHLGKRQPVAGQKYNQYLPPPYEPHELPRLPIAVDPQFVAQRMLVQHSHFTIHGSDTRGVDELLGKDDLNIDDQFHIAHIDADEDGIDRLRWHLSLLGITETSIFPDLEGLARELRFEYGLDRTRPKST